MLHSWLFCSFKHLCTHIYMYVHIQPHSFVITVLLLLTTRGSLSGQPLASREKPQKTPYQHHWPWTKERKRAYWLCPVLGLGFVSTLFPKLSSILKTMLSIPGSLPTKITCNRDQGMYKGHKHTWNWKQWCAYECMNAPTCVQVHMCTWACASQRPTLAVILQVSSPLVLKTVSLAWNLLNSQRGLWICPSFLHPWNYVCPDYYHGVGGSNSFLCSPCPLMTEPSPRPPKSNTWS